MRKIFLYSGSIARYNKNIELIVLCAVREDAGRDASLSDRVCASHTTRISSLISTVLRSEERGQRV
jgi:hypothetical protein